MPITFCTSITRHLASSETLLWNAAIFQSVYQHHMNYASQPESGPENCGISAWQAVDRFETMHAELGSGGDDCPEAGCRAQQMEGDTILNPWWLTAYRPGEQAATVRKESAGMASGTLPWEFIRCSIPWMLCAFPGAGVDLASMGSITNGAAQTKVTPSLWGSLTITVWWSACGPSPPIYIVLTGMWDCTCSDGISLWSGSRGVMAGSLGLKKKKKLVLQSVHSS